MEGRGQYRNAPRSRSDTNSMSCMRLIRSLQALRVRVLAMRSLPRHQHTHLKRFQEPCFHRLRYPVHLLLPSCSTNHNPLSFLFFFCWCRQSIVARQGLRGGCGEQLLFGVEEGGERNKKKKRGRQKPVVRMDRKIEELLMRPTVG